MAGRFAGSNPEPKATPCFKTTSTDVISRFDWVQISSGGIKRVVTSTDNLALWGIALDASASGDDDPVRVVRNDGFGTGVEFIYELETATACLAGELLAFGTLQKLVNTNADAIMVAVGNNSGSSGREVKCVMLIKAKSNEEYLGDAS